METPIKVGTIEPNTGRVHLALAPKAKHIEGRSVGEICQEIVAGNRLFVDGARLDYDTALPHGLFTVPLDAGFDPRGKCVMFYVGGHCMGQIQGLCREYDDALLAHLDLIRNGESA